LTAREVLPKLGGAAKKATARPRPKLEFIHLESRKVDVAGIAIHTNEPIAVLMRR